MIALERTIDSTALPFSMVAAKSHLRVDHAADDEYIATLINTTRRQYEWEHNRIVLTQTWTATLDCFPASNVIQIPLTPLQSVTSVVYTDVNSSSQTLGSSVYTVDTVSETPRIFLNEGFTWPTTEQVINAVTITMVLGDSTATDDVPEDAAHWMKLLMGHLYENRSAVEVGQGVSFSIPDTLKRLGRRVVRF
jgi:uncharacterized phiE125 gp8 family phage protein